MIWVVVAILAVALAGAAALAVYAASLRHKVDDVAAELAVLAGHGAQARALVERLELDRLRRH
ncbi:hypothetical protein TESS_TESS_02622 [Tessaracoccus sp. O5.2]|uniref:hypothetical protein n=1 Tax=Tessaracoccus sp. O5.2 TaxID=3157622 RepID=UPI00077968ED|nr:hypothetical protein BE11_02635 [Sorangium cellulosum]